MIIDAHIHTDFDSPTLKRFASEFKENLDPHFELDDKFDSRLKDMSIAAAISMGFAEQNENLSQDAPTPLVNIVNHPKIFSVAGVNPHHPDVFVESGITSLLKNKSVKGIKIYLGYYHFYANDKVYYPFYELAAQYDVPIVFHTGDTLFNKGKVKYAHPLQIDELAVDLPDVKFVIAHCGNPWLMDTAEVVFKNDNVFADLSGLFVGSSVQCRGEENSRDKLKQRLIDMILYVDDYTKFIYGSDWPLVSMSEYYRFIRDTLLVIYPNYLSKDKSAIFFDNANKLFKLGL